MLIIINYADVGSSKQSCEWTVIKQITTHKKHFMYSVLDQKVVINLQENDIVTFLAAMLLDLSFQTVGNFSCITLQIIHLLFLAKVSH